VWDVRYCEGMSTKLKPFGVKAYTFAFRHPSEDKPITILEGSIRSGKTYSFHPKIITQLCTYDVAGLKVIIGVSKSTIKDNLLRDLFEIVGEANYNYNLQTGELRLFKSTWIVIGAKDEGSEKYLRGKTIGVALVEEGVLIPESFMMQLLGRLSPVGSRLYINTNPDSPFHYLKVKVIDNEEMSQDVEVIHFDLDDNPNLAKETRAKYERMFKGVFYDRFIRGLWVIAEGAIYRDCLGPQCEYGEDQRPVGLENRGWAHYVIVDYGTVNAFAGLEVWDDGKTLWQDREYYWDSRVERVQKTDEQYADELDEFIGPNKRGLVIIVDPSAASFKLVLVKRGYQVKNGKNDVEEGIRKTASALTMGLYRIRKAVKGQKANKPDYPCITTPKELANYAWDEKKAIKTEEEQPIKKKDHTADCVRMAVHTLLTAYRLER